MRPYYHDYNAKVWNKPKNVHRNYKIFSRLQLKTISISELSLSLCYKL